MKSILMAGQTFNMVIWLMSSLSLSVKWVGVFVVALVGLTTIKDLWDLLGDLTIPMVLLWYCTMHAYSCVSNS